MTWITGPPYSEADVGTLIDECVEYRVLLEDLMKSGFIGERWEVHIGFILNQWNKVWGLENESEEDSR